MENHIINNNNSLINQKIIHCKKIYLKEIDFVRASCSIGILIFHYFCHSRGSFKFLFNTANSGWGFMFVTSFFAISGTVLYYNYPTIISIKKFYFKRWKSIFPSYYICFLYFYLSNVFKYKKIFYRLHWSRLIFTVFGMDGYLLYRFETYYLIGEWFIGAIIIIYALYPILLMLTNKNFLVLHLFLCIGYLLMYKTKFFVIQRNRNIITCINSFVFGISAIKLKKFFFPNKLVFIISLAQLIFLCNFNIGSCILIHQIQGFSLFMVLLQIGRFIMNTRLSKIFQVISNLSYFIFLVHHQIIIDIFKLYYPSEWYFHLLLIGLIIIFSIVCSKIFSIIVTNFIKSFLFQKIESLF